MAGFFSLGGGGGGGAGGGGRANANSPPHNNEEDDDHHHNHHQSNADININPHSQSLFWAPYKNEQPAHNPYKPSSSSSFELWQTQDHTQQFNLYHHHHHHRQQQQDLYTSAAALGVGPTANPILDGGGGSEHHLHQHQARAATSGSGSGGVSCQDCGNQAKKDCVHMRCRTCCKSRGFDCSTHIKSTWVPASKRRERQQLQQPGHHHHHHHHDHDNEDHNNNHNQQILQISTKRHRDSISSLPPNTLTSRLPSSSGLEVGNFPTEVSSNAVFRCVRVSSVDSADDQYAYQTAVSIGGHLFKGILLDHGPETTTTNYSTSTIGGGGGGETSSGGGGGGGGGVSQPLDLIATSAGTTAAGHQVTQFVDPSALYQGAQPINAYAIAGTQFFLPPRS